MRWLSPFFLALFLHSYCVRADQINVQDISSRDLPAAIHNGFIRLALHSSIRAGATIYIDGGEINFRGSIGGTGTGTVTLNNTLTLDLSKSWKPAEVPFQFIDKPPSTPVLNHGTLWPALDNQSIFSFGGVRSPFPSALRIQSVKLWKYSFSTGWLGLTSQSPVSPTLTNARPAAAAETHGKGIGYMLGGFRGNDHAPFWPLPGMLTYNMTDNSWTNESTTALTPFGTIGGSLTYVPGFGQDGILIAMGGEYTGSGPWTETASNLISFTNISIWDIASKTWYSQPATANTNVSDSTVNLPDIPTSVTTFCSAGIASQQGTYEIFVYGGYSNTFLLSSEVPSEADAKAQASLNGVYVLSLPSFTWTKVSSTGAASRTGHTCHVVGNRQMLSIGGLDPSKAINLSRNSLDPWQHGLGIFDMVDLKWKENYDVNAPAYVTPKIVSAWYESHNLTSSVQWTSAQVQALFVTALPASAELSQAPASSTIVVVPIVLGILIPLGIFIALGILLYRQFRRKKHDVAKSDSCPESGDDLTNNIRAHLAEARQSYLTQRDAFVQRSSPGSHCSGVIFHPSDLSSEYSQPHTAETPMTVRSASSLLFETHNVIRPLVVRRTSNQRHAPTVANLPRPIRDEFYPRSSSSITPPVPSSPTSSNPAQAWRQPNPPMQWNTEKYPVVEIPRASESTNRSGFIVISNGPRPSYELYAPSTPLQEADLRATSLNRQSRPHELE